jgi:hypothetical protein
MSIMSSTKGNNGSEAQRHDDPNPQNLRNPDHHRPPDQPDGRAGGQGVGGPHPGPSQGNGPLIPGTRRTQGGIVMKEKAKNVKTDRKFWNDPMSFPVFTPKRGK